MPTQPTKSIIIVGTKKDTSELLKSAFSDQGEKDAWHSAGLAIEEDDFDGSGRTIHYLLSPFNGAILTIDINERSISIALLRHRLHSAPPCLDSSFRSPRRTADLHRLELRHASPT